MTSLIHAFTLVAFLAAVVVAVRSDTVTSLPVGAQQTPDARRVGQPRDPLPYYIVEELPASTPIGCVPTDARLDRIYDVDQLRGLRYAVGSQTPADRPADRVDLFAVDPTSGVVTTTTRIDRDRMCAGRPMCIVLLDVIVGPAEHFRVVRIAVDILDVNDHAPDFGTDEIRLRVPESAHTGTGYALPAAVDPDSDQFGVNEYRLTAAATTGLASGAVVSAVDSRGGGNDVVLPFRLDYEPRFNELRLVVVGRLDRESVAEYRLLVESRDGGQPIRTGSVRLTVAIDDENDNAPTFDRPVYELHVTENSPPGSIVGRVRAADPDAGIYGRIGYRLQRQNDQDGGGTADDDEKSTADGERKPLQQQPLFVVDPDSGIIFVASTIDYERGTEYRLRVTAYDMASSGNDDDVIDVRQTGSELLSSASAPNRSAVHQHHTHHHSDGGGARQSLESTSSHHAVGSGRGRTGGRRPEIEAAVPLADVLLRRNDDGVFAASGSLTGYATVRVRVVDRNDNAPRIAVNSFRSPPDVAAISESAPPGTFVAYVTASDADAGHNGLVACSVRADNDGDDVIFRLESMTSSLSTYGSDAAAASSSAEYRLVTASGLDRERGRRHVVAIVCRDLAGDGGEISRESRVDVVVDVLDENDHPPRFERQTYDCQVVENNAIGDVIVVVKATDEDHGVNGQVRYSLQSDYEHLFAVDPLLGAVTTRVSFDREHLPSLSFVVVASDLGVPSPLSSSTLVHVAVVNVDDHAPGFDRRDYAFVVYENRPPGTEVGHVIAVDRDDDDDDDDAAGGPTDFRFRYDLVPDLIAAFSSADDDDNRRRFVDEFPLPFGINSATGRIVTRSALDRERRAEYRLRALAHATSGLFRTVTATARVVVHVLDVNDNRPRIHWPPPPNNGVAPSSSLDPLRVSALAPPGHVIAVVSADDPDAGDNGRLRYAVVVGGSEGDERGDAEGPSLFGTMSPDDGRIVVRRPLVDCVGTPSTSASPSSSRSAVTLASSTSAAVRTFSLKIVVSDSGTPRLTAAAVLNVVVDGNLPFAHAQRTVSGGDGDTKTGSGTTGNGGGAAATTLATVVIVLSCLSALFVLLLVAVIVVLRRYLADRKEFDRRNKDGGGSSSGCGGGKANVLSNVLSTTTYRMNSPSSSCSLMKRYNGGDSTTLADVTRCRRRPEADGNAEIGTAGAEDETCARFRRRGVDDADDNDDEEPEVDHIKIFQSGRLDAILAGNGMATTQCGGLSCRERLLLVSAGSGSDCAQQLSADDNTAEVTAYFRM